MIRKQTLNLVGQLKVVSKSQNRHIVAGYGCLSDDSEILTTDGWKTYKNISINDTIYSYNRDKNILEQDTLINVFSYPYEDKLIYLQSSSKQTNGGYFKWLLTPNHKVLYRKGNKYYLREAKDLPNGIEIPTTAMYINPNDDYPISDNYIKLLAWIITEGHIDNLSGCIWITQSIKENKNYVDDIRNCFSDENISISEYTSDDGEIKKFRIFKNEPKLKLIKKLLNNENIHIIPRWILNNLSQRQLLLFYNTLINGDGSRKLDTDGETFYTILKENADIMQEIGILLGYSTKCRIRRNCWEVFFNKNRQFRTIQKGDIGTEDYSGIVWCVETRNHTFIARRDGVPFITGNSVAIVDKENQFIPLETLKAGLNTLLNDMSYANLMLSHNNIQIGKILKSYGKLITHVDDKGLFIIAEIRNDTVTANDAWEKILKGEMNGFSIGCEVLSEPREVCDSNGCVTYLDKINILEVSICSKPVNQMSGFTVISKSDTLGNDVCKSCNINTVDKMTDEKKEEQKVEEKEETKELSIEERLEEMERSIFNIKAALTKMMEGMKQEEDEVEEKPEEVPPEEEKPEEPKKAEEPVKAEETQKVETVDESKTKDSATPEVFPSVTKTDFEEFKQEISKILGTLTESLKAKEKDAEIADLKLSIKARDEVIENMKNVTKPTEEETKKEEEKVEEDEPKTVKDEQKEKLHKLEEECPIVFSNGEITARKFV